MPDWGNTGMLKSIDFEAVTFSFVRVKEQNVIGMMFQKKSNEPSTACGFQRLNKSGWVGLMYYELEAVHSIREDLTSQGVFFDMDSVSRASRNSQEILEQWCLIR